jgi:hypothetical protein
MFEEKAINGSWLAGILDSRDPQPLDPFGLYSMYGEKTSTLKWIVGTGHFYTRRRRAEYTRC